MRPTQNCSSRPITGFTAIELVIVVTILGILAALAAPLLEGSVTDARLSAATADFVSAVEFAQMSALSSGRTCRISADSSTEILRVEQRTFTGIATVLDPAVTEIASNVIESGESYAVMANPSLAGGVYIVNFRDMGVDIQSSDMGSALPLSFSASGTPSKGAGISLACGGRSRKISIDALTGKVASGD